MFTQNPGADSSPEFLKRFPDLYKKSHNSKQDQNIDWTTLKFLESRMLRYQIGYENIYSVEVIE